MPTSYVSSSFNPRTYSRKSSIKRRHSVGEDNEPGLDQGVPKSHVRKRRKVSVEVVLSDSEAESTQRDKSKSRESSTFAEREISPIPLLRTGSAHITYGSPKRKPKSPSPTPSPYKAPKVARDLSGIFQSITPTPSPSSTPTKLAKRMLARSKTDSSIEGHTSNSSRFHTPSLPNLTSPSSSKTSNTISSLDVPPPPSAPAPATTRTYAGKSRSFLVAIPTSGISASNPFHTGFLEEEEDDYSTRESYASLRTRWGVDNSEDDPYPNPSPSRSDATSTPSGTPSKPGKGKGKANQDGQSKSQTQLPLPNGMMNPLKSITELRSKGESRRFLDEVGYLFEGMDPNGGIGLRRASALEITTKLCDVEFSRKAKAADILGRTWDVFGEAGAGHGEDMVLDTLLAFFAALVSRDAASLADLAQRVSSEPATISPSIYIQKNQKSPPGHRASLVDTLFFLMSMPTDPLALVSPSVKSDKSTQDVELRKLGVSKKDNGLFITIHNTIASNSSLFPADISLSTPLLAARSLQTLPPSFISTKHLPALFTSLQKSLSPVISSSLSSYLTWPDAAHHLSYENVFYHLRLLDTYLLDQWKTWPPDNAKEDQEEGYNNDREMEQAKDTWLVDALIALGVCAEIKGGVAARKCTEMAFRVLVSLTHGDETWGKKVIESECALGLVARAILRSGGSINIRKAKADGNERIKPEDGEDTDVDEEVEGEDENTDNETQALDKLCLALGLLTNLVQVVVGAKELLRDTRLDPSCNLTKRSCIRQCTCTSRKAPVNVLDVLVQLYVRQLSPAVSSNTIKRERSSSPADTADASFLRGHLAVLFGLLMRGSQENQDYVLAALDGTGVGTNKKTKLNRLADQAREFVAFYAALSGSVTSDTTHDGGNREFSAKEKNTDRERRQEGKIARDIVTFLERLALGSM